VLCVRDEGTCAIRVTFPHPGRIARCSDPNSLPPATKERNDKCGNQHYSRELLMMGIVVPETCWAYKKYNKIISGIYLVFILQLFNVSASYVSEFFFFAISVTEETYVVFPPNLSRSCVIPYSCHLH
jgi:hypothetical protein